jgi:hypothetical protein
VRGLGFRPKGKLKTRISVHKGPNKIGSAARRCCKPPLRLIIGLVFGFVFSAAARAHDVPRSESRVQVHGREAQVVLRLNLLELGYVDLNGDNLISYDEMDRAIDRIYADVKQHYVLRSPALPTQITLEREGVIEDHVLDMQLLYVFPQNVTQLQVNCTLYQVTQPSHEHLISVTMEGVVHEAVLDRGTPSANFSAGTSYLKTIESFVGLGIRHIFTGYDHLSFLIGLLIVTTSLGSLVRVVTSFTLAHSITLALATFDIIVLPSRLTESMIALSIAYVAIENLLGKRAIERHRITFLFGLAHGFGFSNVLREMQLSRSHLALSLFSFNAGVEIGQLTFVLMLFPLIVYLASTSWRQQIRTGISTVVMCLALYWFVRRAFLV